MGWDKLWVWCHHRSNDCSMAHHLPSRASTLWVSRVIPKKNHPHSRSRSNPTIVQYLDFGEKVAQVTKVPQLDAQSQRKQGEYTSWVEKGNFGSVQLRLTQYCWKQGVVSNLMWWGNLSNSWNEGWDQSNQMQVHLEIQIEHWANRRTWVQNRESDVWYLQKFIWHFHYLRSD